MEKSQWIKVRQIFDHVRDQSPSFRTNYLDMVCDGDDALQHQVERMLRAHDDMQNEQETASFSFGNSQVPQRIGDYQIDSELGRGGMGVVYRAVHQHYGTVALKVLPVRLLQDQRASKRFAQEASLLAKLNHPIVCAIHDAGVDSDYAYMAMDVIDGCTLAHELSQHPLPLIEALDITLQLADGLTQAHAVGVTHRDIKPSNVLLDNQRYPRLIDFGIAKFADTRLTATGELMGSPAYMSPEQWRGTAVDARTDVWSLGVLLYEMIAGQPPFSGDSIRDMAQNVLSGTSPPLPGISIDEQPLHETQQVIFRMIERDRDLRLSDMTAVTAAVSALKRNLY
ncbi:MAG: serine/threonine-protein kinase [Pseudomonadota bacterium]